MNGRTGVAVLGAVLALTLVLASCGKTEEKRLPPAKPPVGVTMPPPRASDDPPIAPPECPVTGEPKDPVVNPPPAEPLPPVAGRAPGWRLGQGLDRFATPPPPGVEQMCSACHAVPSPDVIVQPEWYRVIGNCEVRLRHSKNPPEPETMRAARAWYIDNAPGMFDRLPPAPDPGSLEFSRTAIGGLKRESVMVTNVNVVDMDGDGQPEVLVCDAMLGTVSIVRRVGKEWKEDAIGTCKVPVHTAVFDADGDKDLDVAVAVMGDISEVDDPVGAVLLLVNKGADGWEKRELAKGLPRVTDAEPADFDGDGDPDLVVGAFGGHTTGRIGWLRNDGAKWTFIEIATGPGTIHVPVADFDGDGRPDFVALVAQEFETITVYLNKGGTFEPKVVFDPRNPLFGSSGLQLADLDNDGDLDMLFTNGDAMSDSCLMPWPYHGVQWLENRGKLEFVHHDIGRCYGPFGATAADLDGDGDKDVAVAVQFGWWGDKAETGLLWYENDGKMNFTRHQVPAPNRFITIAAGNLDGDGAPEIVTGQCAFGGENVDGCELLMWSITKKK